MPEPFDDPDLPGSGSDDPPLPVGEALRPRKFKRQILAETLDEPLRERFVQETFDFLNRRFDQLAVRFDDISKTNFNPFLLLITAPVYNIFSPLEVAERLQLGKAFHGDDTAFGKLAEDKFLTILGASSPPQKRSTDSTIRNRWSSIDLQSTIDGQLYLMSIKAGPWTMNQSHANEMIRHFNELREETGAKIIIGITYGRYRNLNNKPLVVQRGLDNPDWYDFLVGKDLWEFVSGVKNVHKEIFKAVRIAQRRFALEHSDETFSEKLIANRLKISSSLRKQFKVAADDDFWGTLFNSMFESDVGLPGYPDHASAIVIDPEEIDREVNDGPTGAV